MEKPKPQASVCYISGLFSKARRVLSQCNTRLRLLYLLIISLFKGILIQAGPIQPMIASLNAEACN